MHQRVFTLEKEQERSGFSELQCTGSESTLTNCRFNGWGINANHAEDAGVVCSGKVI